MSEPKANSGKNIPAEINLPKGPLDGIRVLDLSRVVSGPMAAVILADQGADVIKVEPPGWGDGIRFLGASRNGLSAIFSLINRNKRSIAINLKHPEGADIIRKLAIDADVVMQNYRPGKIEKLGLGYEDLKDINPNLVYLSINGMGESGPLSDQKVYDYVIQGISGITDAQTDPTTATNQKMVRSIIYDKVTALTAAQSITAALLARERGGTGQHIRLSMLDTGLYFNWPDLMWNHTFIGDDVELSGDLADTYDVHPTADGAIVAHHLGADTSPYSTDQLMEILASNDIPAGRANKRHEVMEDPQVIASKILETLDHPRGGKMILPRAPARFSGTPLQQRRHSPEVGQHTAEILTEQGMSREDIIQLAQKGVIG
jgi:crotonobetainyl-CoA:carnitine CoA-transferase CaiB-like acyl-CoA transferase